MKLIKTFKSKYKYTGERILTYNNVNIIMKRLWDDLIHIPDRDIKPNCNYEFELTMKEFEYEDDNEKA